jgi:hypothetical protein
MSWAAGRVIEGTRVQIGATASHGPETQRRHTVACISGHSEPEHPASEPPSGSDGTAATAPSRAPASSDGGQSGWEIGAAWLGVLAVGVA